MTSPEVSLFPTCGDDRSVPLTAAQLVASSRLEFGQLLGTEVRQGMALLPALA
jgi:hypothetical protein